MAEILMTDLWKIYGETPAVRGINLHIDDGKFIALVGPSGCGKTTTLRMIAGLEDITGGEIAIDNKVINDVPPRDRDIAMVFQNYALYPHMSVYQNMAFGLKLRKTGRAEIDRRVEVAADILNIGELLQRRPRQLSGGQRQRVAMGRAIVRNPRVFLFDEPLSNLDAKLRVQMRTEIKKIHQRLRTTVVYVTHDQIEAMTLADTIVVMNHGVIEQVGTPDDMYNAPVTRFVASFIGSPAMNFVACRLERAADGLEIRVGDDLALSVPREREGRYAPHAGRDLELGIRPEHITNRRHHSHDGFQDFEAGIKVVEPMGMDTMVFFDIAGTEVCARCEPKSVGNVDAAMGFTFDKSHMHLIDPDTEKVV